MWDVVLVGVIAGTVSWLLKALLEMFWQRRDVQDLQTQVEWLLAYLGLEVDDEGFIVPVDPGGPGHRVE